MEMPKGNWKKLAEERNLFRFCVTKDVNNFRNIPKPAEYTYLSYVDRIFM